jgi:hypothetical protein
MQGQVLSRDLVMTAKEMIVRLSMFPPEAVMQAWDPDCERYVDVTGFLYIPTTHDSAPDIVEMQTDVQ